MATSQLILLNQLSNWVWDLSLSVSKRIGHLALTSGDVEWLTMSQLYLKWNPNTALHCVMRPGRWQRISQREWPRDCLHLRLRPSHQRLPDDVLSSKKAMFLPRYAASKSLYCAKSVVLIYPLSQPLTVCWQMSMSLTSPLCLKFLPWSDLYHPTFCYLSSLSCCSQIAIHYISVTAFNCKPNSSPT